MDESGGRHSNPRTARDSWGKALRRDAKLGRSSFLRASERAATHPRGLRAAIDADVLIPTYGIGDNTSCAGGDVKATAVHRSAHGET